MTPKEALNILDETVIGNLELKIVLSNAIEKQIPKKPLMLGRQYVGVARAGICKNCSMTENSSANYCRYCGQALDWGNSE